jgi:AcrR family transcriptional regulator
MPSPSVDPRVARSRAAVIAATRELLIEEGIAGVTIDGVAARSGVAKTTIYRQWTDRNHLLIDAMEETAIDDEVAVTDDLHADLLGTMQRLSVLLSNPTTSGLIPALIEAAERDADFREISRPFVDARRRPIMSRLRHAVRDGQLHKDADIELICALLVGPLFYRRLLSRQPTPNTRMLSELVRTVLSGTNDRA